MRIEQSHTLGQDAAIDRLDQLLGRLVQNPPAGVTVKDARRDWHGNRMSFSFTASKGFFGTTIEGLMRVTEDKVVVESELPSLVRNLLGEERIRHVIAEQLGKVLKP